MLDGGTKESIISGPDGPSNCLRRKKAEGGVAGPWRWPWSALWLAGMRGHVGAYLAFALGYPSAFTGHCGRVRRWLLA